MARGGPSTGGSKGGGNVVPTNQPTMSDNAYRSSRPFPSGNRQPISPRSYTNIFTGPRQPTMGGRFGTLGGLGYGPNPLGSAGPRGFVANNYPYGRGMSGYNRYGGMQGPTGLGGFLSRQPAISQRQIDPATGFPARPQSYGAVMGRPNFGSIGRNASKGKSGSKGGARTFNPESQAVVDEYNRNPDPTLGKSLPPPTYGTVTGLPSGLTPEQARIRQEELASRTGGGFSRLAPGNVQVSDVFMEGVERANEQPFDADQYLRAGGGGRGVSPIYTQGLPKRPMFQTQGPESLMGEITQSPRYQAMQMGQAGGRPNIRPTMNVGKATGGPVGLASLIGMSNGGPTVQEGDGYRGAFNVQRMPPQTEKEARAIFDYDLEMDALNSAQEYLLNRFGRASLPEGRAPRDPATYQVDGIEELIMSSKGMR